jgi:hypothetical protein
VTVVANLSTIAKRGPSSLLRVINDKRSGGIRVRGFDSELSAESEANLISISLSRVNFPFNLQPLLINYLSE